MKKMIINGKEIKTNIIERGECRNYSTADIERPTMYYERANFGECDTQMLKRLVEEGYTTITFYEMTTNVKGLHKLYAYCRY